jgi:hypothetical protein
MKPEELLQRIAKLKTVGEKVKFLKSLLKQIDEEQTKKLIKGLIKQLETQKQDKDKKKGEDIEEILGDVPTATSSAVPQVGPIKLEDYKAPPESIETEVEPERPLAERREGLPSYLKTEAALREGMEQATQQSREEAMLDYERMLEERRSMRDLSDRLRFSKTDWNLQGRDLVSPAVQNIDDERYKTMSDVQSDLGELTDRIKWHHRENHLTERKLDKYRRKDEV